MKPKEKKDKYVMRFDKDGNKFMNDIPWGEWLILEEIKSMKKLLKRGTQ